MNTSVAKAKVIHKYLETLFGRDTERILEIFKQLAKGVRIDRPIIIYGLYQDIEINNLSGLIWAVAQKDSLVSLMYHPTLIDSKEINLSKAKLNRGYKATIHITRPLQFVDPKLELWFKKCNNEVLMFRAVVPVKYTKWEDLQRELFLFTNDLNQ